MIRNAASMLSVGFYFTPSPRSVHGSLSPLHLYCRAHDIFLHFLKNIFSCVESRRDAHGSLRWVRGNTEPELWPRKERKSMLIWTELKHKWAWGCSGSPELLLMQMLYSLLMFILLLKIYIFFYIRNTGLLIFWANRREILSIRINLKMN